MTHDEFTRLFKYSEMRFAEVDKRFDGVSLELAKIYNAIAELSADVKNNYRETSLLIRIVDRHEKWFHQLATKTDTKLDY